MQTVGRKGPYGVRDGLQVVGGHWLTWGLELGQGDLRDVEGWSKYQRILPLPNGFVFVNLPAFSLSLFFSSRIIMDQVPICICQVGY